MARDFMLWLELIVGTISSGLFLLTLARPDWIELATGFEPDGGNGALEFAIVLSLAALAAVCGVMARRRIHAGV